MSTLLNFKNSYNLQHCFVPMHYGTVFISKDSLQNPLAKMHSYWQEKKEICGTKRLLVARCGQEYIF